MTNCPKCGFDLAAESLLKVIRNKAGVDPLTIPEHYAGYHHDLENLVKLGYAIKNKAGWYIPTNKETI